MNNISKANKQIVPPKILTWLISGAFFMQMIDSTILNTALPDVAKSLGEEPLEMQSIIVAYMLTVAFLLPLSGWISDRIGAKNAFLSAIIIFTTGSACCAYSSTMTELVISRVFQGIGGSLMVPVGRLIVLRIYPKKDFVKVLSFILLPASLGPILGPPLGGFLAEYLSWHWIFLINIPIGIITFMLAKIKMPYIEKEEIEKFDWLGFFAFSIAVIMIILSSSQTKIVEFSLQAKFLMFGMALLLLAFFWFHINRSKHPLFHVALLKVPSFRVGLIGNMFSRLGFSAMPLLIPLLLQVGLGFSPSKSGLYILVIGVFSVIGRFKVSQLVNKLGFRLVLIFNTIAVGMVILCFSFIDIETKPYVIFIILAMLGIVNSIQFSSMNSLTLIDLPKKFSAEGNSLLSVVMQVCVTLGISTSATMLNFFESSSNIDTLNAFRYTFLVMGCATILSSASFLFTPRDAGK